MVAFPGTQVLRYMPSNLNGSWARENEVPNYETKLNWELEKASEGLLCCVS